MPPHVVIHTDGTCHPNPGVGAFAALLAHGEHTREIIGGHHHTTSNQMELMGAIVALRALKRACTVTLVTDSQYLQRGASEWVRNWPLDGAGAVLNAGLWKWLLEAAAPHTVEWRWVRGHAGHAGNEQAHSLADQARRALIAGEIEPCELPAVDLVARQ